jgi:hypothetical protein
MPAPAALQKSVHFRRISQVEIGDDRNAKSFKHQAYLCNGFGREVFCHTLRFDDLTNCAGFIRISVNSFINLMI